MRSIPIALSNKWENEFFKDLKGVFTQLEDNFFELNDPLMSFDIHQYAKSIFENLDFVIGEPITKSQHIPTLFNRVEKNLVKIMNETVSNLDSMNNLNIGSTDFLEDMQKKAVSYRRWKIVTNRTSRTVKKRIKSAVNQAIDANQRPDTLRHDIVNVFKKYNDGKAFNTRTIARTELYSVVRHAEYQYMVKAQKELGIKLQKHWYTRADERVRTGHVDYKANGWIGFKEKFQSSVGTEIRYPLDNNGEAGDVINCRCRLRFRQV